MHTKGPGGLCPKGVMQIKRTIMFLLTFSLLLGGCGSDAEVYLAGEEESPKAAPQEESAAAENAEEPDSGDAQKDGTIWVYVCGAVHAPGVYELPSGSRIYHVIQAAGGMLPEAETRAVNQAQELSDGEQITVPTVEEAQEPAQPAVSGGSAVSGDGKVNLNTAGIEELCTLTGIGETRAQAIVDYREQNGGFQSIEELMNIDGIKEKTFEKLKEEVTVG